MKAHIPHMIFSEIEWRLHYYFVIIVLCLAERGIVVHISLQQLLPIIIISHQQKNNCFTNAKWQQLKYICHQIGYCNEIKRAVNYISVVGKQLMVQIFKGIALQGIYHNIIALLNTMMQSSFHSQFEQFQKPQQQTAQTLSSFSTPSIDTSFYHSALSSEEHLLTHTLAHCNIYQIEKELEKINYKAALVASSYAQKQVGICSTGFSQNLAQVSDSIIISLAKVQAYRKILKQKLAMNLLLKAKQTNRKNRIKANLFKYKQLLLIIKKLKDKIVTNECLDQQQLNQEKCRLQTSGLMLVPSLLQKGLLNLVAKAIYQTKKQVKIKNISNLRVIVDSFMNNKCMRQLLYKNSIEASAYSWIESSNQQLYFQFKQYIHLKKYLNVRFLKQSQIQLNHQFNFKPNALDKLCQQKIHQYIFNCPESISKLQITKIYSVSQCEQITYTFLQHEVQISINDMFNKIVNFVQNCKDKLYSINKTIVHDILTKNKHKKQYKIISIPFQYVHYIENSSMQFIFELQQLIQLLQQIQNKSSFIKVFFDKYQICFNENQIYQVLINAALRVLIEPLFKISLGITKILRKSEQERKYQFIRQIYQNIETVKELFSKQNMKNHQSIIQQIKKSISKGETKYENKKISKEKNKLKKINKQHKNNKNRKINQINMTMAQFYMQYNEKYGQMFLYLANRWANNKSERNKEQNNMETKIEEYQKLWCNLISQQIIKHQLQQMQPANLLSEVEFMQSKIIELVQQKHEIQNKLNQIQMQMEKNKKIAAKNAKHFQFQLQQQEKEIIYNKIMRLNFKTRNYSKLIAINKAIGEHSDVKWLHSQLYGQFHKQIEL